MKFVVYCAKEFGNGWDFSKEFSTFAEAEKFEMEMMYHFGVVRLFIEHRP